MGRGGSPVEISVLLQIKQMAYLWLVVGNVILAAWAIGLYVLGRNTAGEFYFRVVVFFQVLILLAVVGGVSLIATGSGTTPGHWLYAASNALLALVRIFWHGRLMQTGRTGLLWLTLLAVTAVALAARARR